MDVGGSAVLTAASSLAAANLTGVLPAISGAALTNLPIPASAVTLISTFTISTAVATVDIALPTSGYTTLSLLVTGIVPSSNSSVLYGRTSSDGGSTFDSGAGNYFYSGNLLTEMRFNASLYTASGSSASYVMYIQNRSGIYNYIYGLMAEATTNNMYATHLTPNARNSTVQINALRLYPTAGTLIAGSFSLYGWT